MIANKTVSAITIFIILIVLAQRAYTTIFIILIVLAQKLENECLIENHECNQKKCYKGAPILVSLSSDILSSSVGAYLI